MKILQGIKFPMQIKGEKVQLSEFSEEEIVKCSIKHFKFSAHSKREELIEIVKKFKPEKVILVHGDEEAIGWMGNRILKDFKSVRVYQAKLEAGSKSRIVKLTKAKI